MTARPRIEALTAIEKVNKEVLVKIEKEIRHYKDNLITATEAYGKIKEIMAPEFEDERFVFDKHLGLGNS